MRSRPTSAATAATHCSTTAIVNETGLLMDDTVAVALLRCYETEQARAADAEARAICSSSRSCAAAETNQAS